MDRLKTALRVSGIVIALIGTMCLPVGFGVSPKRDLSLFYNLADLGAFVSAGLILIVVGLVALAISYAVPGEMVE